MTVLHNLQLKFYLKLSVLSLNQKPEVALVFQKHQSTGHQKVVEQDTSQNKLRLRPPHFLSQNITVQLEKTKCSNKGLGFLWV